MPEVSPQKILVLFVHPALEKSRVNRRLADAARGVEGITFHDLYETYPDFHIFVHREQALLTDHDVIVFQFPFFWYSTPALLKEWQDLVLQHGWAFGSEGTALRGKTAVFAVSTGGSEASYQTDGYNRHQMRQLLSPLYQTCRLCGVETVPPFVVHGTHAMQLEAIDRHAADYRRLLEAIQGGRLDLSDPGLDELTRLNQDLDQLLAAPEGGDRHAR